MSSELGLLISFVDVNIKNIASTTNEGIVFIRIPYLCGIECGR